MVGGISGWCLVLVAALSGAETVVIDAIRVAPPASALEGASKWGKMLDSLATPARERARIDQALVAIYLDPTGPPVSRKEAEALLTLKGGVDSVHALGEALHDETTGPRAARLLARHPRPEAATMLLRCLSTAPESVQGTILEALAARNVQRAAPVVAEYIRQDQAHKSQAIAVLGVLGGRDSAYLLKELLDWPEPAIQHSARMALEVCAAQFEADGLTHRAAACREAIARHEQGEAIQEGWQSLFDGETFDGWNGNLDWFRIEDQAIVGGRLDEAIPRNEFLCTNDSWGDFELRMEVRLLGDDPNAGVQIRSKRIPGYHEVVGYQADLGQVYWGALYDESRRNQILAQPDPALREEIVKKDEWNTYVIRCEGPRIRLWLNGVKTVDYLEASPEIPLRGIIGLQIHSGAPAEAWYRNIRIRPINYTRH